MDAVVKSLLERPQPHSSPSKLPRPSREEAEAAVRVLLRWTGDDPSREGLRDTPKRVVKAYEEFFSGYQEDAASALSRVFEEVEGYDDMVLVRDIPFSSHCEHHMVPFFGMAHVAYYPVDLADCRRDRPAPAPARLRRDARSRASVHVDARRSQTCRGNCHDAVHRHISRRSGRADSILDNAPRRQVRIVPG
jgi:hypothetical protein